MKNAAAAKRAIQEMGASLFYAKVRGEDVSGEEKLTNEEYDDRKEYFASEELLTGKINFNNDKNFANKQNFVSEESIATQIKFAGEGNLAAEDDLTNKESFDGEVNFGSEKDVVSKEHFASDINFGSAISSGPRKISYESPLLSFIAEVGLSSFCVALALRHLLPAEGGRIRIGALSRSLSMSSNNIRLHLEALQAKKIIASPQGDQQGRIIKFLHPFFRSQQGISFFPSGNESNSLPHTPEA